jgi:hypothetical protein
VKRVAIRTGAVTCYLGAAATALYLVAPAVESPNVEPAVAAAPAVRVEAPERPAGVPRQIPAWAWALARWHEDELSAQRPLDAPTPVPKWYWAWREWRLAVDAARS